MLPIGLNMCTPGDQELISLAKIRYSLVTNFLFYFTVTFSMQVLDVL